jgi:multimeric flavodoxin WrbA
MLVLGIGGSPKEDGFTNSLLDRALEGARSRGASVEKVVLNSIDIKPCQDCGGCSKSGKCKFHDGMASVYDKFEKMDAVIIATPIFFGSVTAQLKAMIDRFQCAWISKYVLKNKPAYKGNRKGLFLCAAGQDNIKHFENAKSIVRNLFATLDIEYSGELFFGGSNLRSANEKDKEAALKKAFELGASLIA